MEVVQRAPWPAAPRQQPTRRTSVALPNSCLEPVMWEYRLSSKFMWPSVFKMYQADCRSWSSTCTASHVTAAGRTVADSGKAIWQTATRLWGV